MATKLVSDIVAGDAIDLEGDPFYGHPTGDDHDACLAMAEYEYAIVSNVEQETTNCIRVDFDNGFCSVGWPVSHEVTIRE